MTTKSGGTWRRRRKWCRLQLQQHQPPPMRARLSPVPPCPPITIRFRSFIRISATIGLEPQLPSPVTSLRPRGRPTPHYHFPKILRLIISPKRKYRCDRSLFYLIISYRLRYYYGLPNAVRPEYEYTERFFLYMRLGVHLSPFTRHKLHHKKIEFENFSAFLADFTWNFCLRVSPLKNIWVNLCMTNVFICL